uniref:Uncharacterized protein n=1 Tax=Cacopsylla melanoneura TaxID=428564 RepID=A0A8D9E921_9HEMI
MGFKVSHVLFPCLMLGMVQFSHSDIAWMDINVDGNAWPGIQDFAGKNVCGLSEICKNSFKTFVGNYKKISKDLEAACETDRTIHQEVCWIRWKPFNDFTRSKRTEFECQFWTEVGGTSHARYAEPPVQT